MKNMKNLLIVWNILNLFQYNPRFCKSDVNLISTSPIFGQYKLIFNRIFKCNSSQAYKLQFNYYLLRTANSTTLKGNITLLIPLDDTMLLEFNLAMKDSSGKWKDNTLVQKSPNACSTIKQGFGNSWNKYMESFGINNADCPVPPGFYTGDGVDPSIFKNTNFPQRFTYGTYKLRLVYSRKNDVLSCYVYIFELRRL